MPIEFLRFDAMKLLETMFSITPEALDAVDVRLTTDELVLAVENSIKKAHDHFGALDVVVNNAAYGIGGSVEELSSEEIRQVFEVNVFAVLFANTVFPSRSTSFRFTNKKHLNL